MTTRTTIRRALAPALFAAALPGALSAQAYAAYSEPAPRGADAPRAEALHEQASARGERTWNLEGSEMRRLAGLHLRAADLFAPDDARGVECLRHAANLLQRDDPERAARLQERAADRAMARGDVLTAAHAYLDAASVLAAASRAGAALDPTWAPHARKMAERAQLLAGSPLLRTEEQASIRARIR